MNSIVKRMPKPDKDLRRDNEWNAEFQKPRHWVDLVAGFVAAAGLIDLLEGLIPREPRAAAIMSLLLIALPCVGH
jgi:hypothetical protein